MYACIVVMGCFTLYISLFSVHDLAILISEKGRLTPKCTVEPMLMDLPRSRQPLYNIRLTKLCVANCYLHNNYIVVITTITL